MRRCLLFFTACVFSLFLFGSCTLTRTVTEIVPVPVEIDLSEVVDPVYKLRPDNSKMEIILDVQTTLDIVNNSLQYQMAWELWQNYAEALEKTIDDIQTVYGPKT